MAQTINPTAFEKVLNSRLLTAFMIMNLIIIGGIGSMFIIFKMFIGMF